MGGTMSPKFSTKYKYFLENKKIERDFSPSPPQKKFFSYDKPYSFYLKTNCHAVLKQTEKELQKRQQEIDEYETKMEGMLNVLKKKNADEKSMTTTLKLLQKKIEKLQKQNDEVGEMVFVFVFVFFFIRHE